MLCLMLQPPCFTALFPHRRLQPCHSSPQVAQAAHMEAMERHPIPIPARPMEFASPKNRW